MMKHKMSILLALAAVLLGFYLSRAGLDWHSLLHGTLASRLASLQDYVRREGNWSYVAYLVLFAVLPLAMIPVSLLCVVAGLAFPPVEAGCLIWTGSLACTALSFCLARVLGRWLVERHLMGRYDVLKGWDSHTARHGFKACLLARFMPVPFAFAGYAAGLTSVRLLDLLAATGLAMLPWSILYALFSKTLMDGSMAHLSLGLALLAVLFAAGWAIRRKASVL